MNSTTIIVRFLAINVCSFYLSLYRHRHSNHFRYYIRYACAQPFKYYFLAFHFRLTCKFIALSKWGEISGLTGDWKKNAFLPTNSIIVNVIHCRRVNVVYVRALWLKNVMVGKWRNMRGERKKRERERAIDREKCKLMWHKNRNHEKQIFCEISGRSDIHFTRHVHVVNWIRFVLFLPHFSSFRSCIQSKYQRTNRLPYKSNIITRKYRFISPFTRFKTNQMKIEINAYTQRQ